MAPAVSSLHQADLSPAQLPEQQYNLPESLSPFASPQSSPKPIGVQVALQGLLPQLYQFGFPLATEDARLSALCHLPSPDDLPVQFEQPKQEQFAHLQSVENLQPWQQQYQQQRQGLQKHSNKYCGSLLALCWEFRRISDSSSHSSSGSAQASNQVGGWPSKQLSVGPLGNNMRDQKVEWCSSSNVSAPVFMPHQPYSPLTCGFNSRSNGSASSACGSFGSHKCAGGPRSSSTCSSASTFWGGATPDSTGSCCSSFTDRGLGCCGDFANSIWSAAPFTRARSKSCGAGSCRIDCAATADSRAAPIHCSGAAPSHRGQRGSHSRHSYEAHSRPKAQQPCGATGNSSRACRRSSTPSGQLRHSEQLAVLNRMPHHLLVVALEQRHAPTCGSKQLLVQRLAVLLQQEQETAAAAERPALKAAAPLTSHTAEATEGPATAVHALSSRADTVDSASSSADPGCALSAVSSGCMGVPAAAAAAANLRIPWVEFQHEGVRYRFRRKRPVCSRCGSSGHCVWQCGVEYCGRCQVHGHAQGHACATACKRCGRHHPGEQLAHTHCNVQQCGKCKLYGHHHSHCPRMRCRRCGWYGHALCSPVFPMEPAEQNNQQPPDETITAAAHDGKLQMAGVPSYASVAAAKGEASDARFRATQLQAAVGCK